MLSGPYLILHLDPTLLVQDRVVVLVNVEIQAARLVNESIFNPAAQVEVRHLLRSPDLLAFFAESQVDGASHHCRRFRKGADLWCFLLRDGDPA